MVTSFKDRLSEINPDYLTFQQLTTLQVNLGDICNLSCTHCHVGASPGGKRIMGQEVMEKIATFLAGHHGVTLDITGGCPELNPLFRFFIDKTRGLAARRLLRTNLAIMSEPGMEWLPAFYQEHGLTIIASLPCYLEENVDRQRGNGVFQRSIEALQKLNSIGYGSSLELDLVYNPGGAFIPPAQEELEAAYRQQLLERYGITFTNLFTITNAPIGRFRDELEQMGTYERYLGSLAAKFNPAAAGNIMCRSLMSVDWQGTLFNCDFNQALNLPVTDGEGRPLTIDDLATASEPGTDVVVAQHCYCCTAGTGSSCTGALAA